MKKIDFILLPGFYFYFLEIVMGFSSETSTCGREKKCMNVSCGSDWIRWDGSIPGAGLNSAQVDLLRELSEPVKEWAMESPEAGEGILSDQPEKWTFSCHGNCRQGFSAWISCKESMKISNEKWRKSHFGNITETRKSKTFYDRGCKTNQGHPC